MKHFLHFLLPFFIALLITSTLTAQTGSGWQWSAISGRSNNSPGRSVVDIATDAAGNVYTTGYFMASMSIGVFTITTTGDGTSGGNYDQDAFIAKYDPSGNILWLKKYGVAAVAKNDRGQVITVGSNGIYVGIGNSTPIVLKYDTDGNLVWSKTLTQFEIGGINTAPDGSLIVMTSNGTNKDIFKLEEATGNILWTFASTGIGSNSTSTFRDFVDANGNVYYTAFTTSGGSVNIGGQSFSPARLTSYVVSITNAGVLRWVQPIDNVQVQLSYTIDANGKSYIQIGGGFGATFQGVSTASGGQGSRYLELDNNGNLTRNLLGSPYKGLFRVKADGIYGFTYENGGFGGTVIYGNYYFGIPPESTKGLGIVIKYDKSDDHVIWANSFELTGASYNAGTLNTIETSPSSAVQVGGSFGTIARFGSFTNTTVVGPGSNPTDFYIARFDGTNVQLPPTTTWTGAANNGSWSTAGNWSNGVPTGGSNAIIPAGASGYPTGVTAGNFTGKLTVEVGVSIALPAGFSSPAGVVNNGTIEVTGGGAFSGFGSSQLATLSGTGRLLFTANSPGTIGTIINQSLEINKPGGSVKYNGGPISGSLYLTAGILNAPSEGANLAPLFLSDPNATITYSSTGYITGALKRAINASGTYVFPMAGYTSYSGGPSNYAPVTLTLHNVTGPQNIMISCPGFALPGGTTPNINLGGGNTITTRLNNNAWYIKPDQALSGGNYDVTLQASSYTNGVTDASRYVVIKRPDETANSISNGTNGTTPWGFYGTNGTSTQTGGTTNGGVVSNGIVTATSTGLTSFSTFAIGIALPSVPPGTTTGTSNWTGASNTTWNNAANWDNGIPNSLIDAVIPAGKANYPQVFTTADNARSLQVDAAVLVKLPYNFLANSGIINNGTLEVIGANSVFFYGFGNSSNGFSRLSGSGKILFSNSSPGVFLGTYYNSVEVNRTTNYLYAQNVYIGGSFQIISGNVYTSYSGNETFITMLNSGSTVTATPTYPVQGTLSRTVNPSGTYNYPIGEGPLRYAPVIITTNSFVGTNRLSAQYYSTIYGGRKFTPVNNEPISAVDAGQWTFTPGSGSASGTLDITFEARGYTNVTDISKCILLKGDSGPNWVKIDNAVITESAGMLQAKLTGMPAFTEQSVFIIGQPGKTTQWTGASNTTWSSGSNWTNGVPDFNAKAVFVSGSPIYPASLTVSDNAGFLDVASGVSLKLPKTFNGGQGIVNNGTIEVTGASSFAGFSAPLSGSGTLLFTAASPSGLSNAGTILNNSITLNRAGNFTVNTPVFGKSLTLLSGIIVGNVTMTDPAASVAYTLGSYINGTLNRAVNSTGDYLFPVGTSDRQDAPTIKLNNLSGPQNITVGFTSTISGQAPNTTAQGIPVTDLLNAGIWTITPNIQPTSGNYGVTLDGRGYTNGVADPARYVVLKRPNSGYVWAFNGTNGFSTEANSTVSATANNLVTFSDFAIGIATSGVNSVLPLKLVAFTAVKKDAGVLLQWNTANEVHADKIVVQHSKDAANWYPLASQPARNSLAASYSYQHVTAAAVNYYRLQFVDLDARTTYSDIRKVNMNTVKTVTLYPNPAIAKVVTIDMGSPIIAPVNYKLVDALGRIVLAGNITHQQQSLSLAGVASGNYYLKLSDGNALLLQVK